MQIYISRDGEQNGPYGIEDVNAYLEDGTLLPTDLACQDGMTEWVPISQIPGVTMPGDSVATPIPPSQPVPDGNKKKILIGIGAGMGLLALMAGIWFFFIRDTEEKGQLANNADNNSTTAKPVKELTIKDVVGSYEGDKKGRTVFLDNGVVETYMLVDPREQLVSRIKSLEKRLVDWTKKYGKDNSAVKSIAETLAAEKENLAAVGPPEFPKNFNKILDEKWEIKDGEVHTSFLAGFTQLRRVEPNGDLTIVAVVSENGSRTDIPKEKQETLKKIK